MKQCLWNNMIHKTCTLQVSAQYSMPIPVSYLGYWYLTDIPVYRQVPQALSTRILAFGNIPVCYILNMILL